MSDIVLMEDGARNGRKSRGVFTRLPNEKTAKNAEVAENCGGLAAVLGALGVLGG